MSIAGSGIMAESLSGGNVALELLCSALAIGAALYVLITILGPISGAHFNPAVTLVFFVRKEIALGAAAAFIAVQIISAVGGVMLTHAMFDQPLVQFAVKARSSTGLWIGELVATAGLVVTILVGLRARADAVPALVGAYIGSAIYFTSSTAFANPAVSIGRAFTDTFAGIEASGVAAFIFAQLIGAVFGMGLCRILIGPVR